MSGFDPWSYAERYKSEHANQAALFMWSNMAHRFGLKAASDPASYTERGLAQRYLDAHNDAEPRLKWLHAIHNQGHGDKVRGANAKAEGVKAGVFDLFLPVPRAFEILEEPNCNWILGASNDRYACGLYVELKVGSNRLSVIQSEFETDMKAAGYATGTAWGWLQAAAIIKNYLGVDS